MYDLVRGTKAIFGFLSTYNEFSGVAAVARAKLSGHRHRAGLRRSISSCTSTSFGYEPSSLPHETERNSVAREHNSRKSPVRNLWAPPYRLILPICAFCEFFKYYSCMIYWFCDVCILWFLFFFFPLICVWVLWFLWFLSVSTTGMVVVPAVSYWIPPVLVLDTDIYVGIGNYQSVSQQLWHISRLDKLSWPDTDWYLKRIFGSLNIMWWYSF